jgi:RNA polymerase sigma-70 factor, ECF subfamily
MLWELFKKFITGVKRMFETDASSTGPLPPEKPVAFGQEELHSSALLPELRKIAKARMRRERSDHTLQATELVNELYLRLLRQPNFTWRDKDHFLLSASRAMRHFLVDYARERQSVKRGGRLRRFEVIEMAELSSQDCGDVMDVEDALIKLAGVEPRMAQVVELKFFGGLTFEEIGRVLCINERTAKRDWTLARTWLRAHLGGTSGDEGGRVGED